MIGVPVELEVVDVFGEWKLGNRELVLDRSRLLLTDLGREQIADNALWLMLALDGGRHDLVEGGLHAVKLELAHDVSLGLDHDRSCLIRAILDGCACEVRFMVDAMARDLEGGYRNSA